MLTEYQLALLERAHRGDRWPTWRVHAHSHTFSGIDSCADTAARESQRDEMFVLQGAHTLSCMCPSGR